MSKELKLSIRHFIDSRTKNQEQRVCIIVYIIGVVMAITGMPLHLLGVLGINNPVLQTISVASWTVSVIVFGLYLKRLISLITQPDKGGESAHWRTTHETTGHGRTAATTHTHRTGGVPTYHGWQDSRRNSTNNGQET